DVMVGPDTLARLADRYGQGDVDGLIGVQAAAMRHRDLVSQYKNLWMRWTYVRQTGEVPLFYTTAAAIRRDAFLSTGAFDEGDGGGAARRRPGGGGRRGPPARHARAGSGGSRPAGGRDRAQRELPGRDPHERGVGEGGRRDAAPRARARGRGHGDRDRPVDVR